MKKRYIFTVLVLISGFLFFYGCGGAGTGGAPGSSGSEETGILVKSVNIIGNDDTPDDIDVNIHLCEGGEPEVGLFREDATITIGATRVNPGLDTFPATVEECTITYLKDPGDPASPIIEAMTIYPNCSFTDADSNECRVQLLDIQRKVDFWDDVTSGKFVPRNMPTRYVASYDCRYFNVYREEGFFKVEYEIYLADFEMC